MVLFVGAGGVNETILLHCHGLTGNDRKRRCDDYARPTARSFERAEYFWAIYVEDERTPFDTTIDVEFGQHLRDPEYEEFDPGAAILPDESSDELRTIRIGWRRFQIRDAPIEVQVAFSRQGPGYNLRQWVRVYRQRSKEDLLPSGTVFLPTVPVLKHETTFGPVYPDGSIRDVAHVLQQSTTRRFGFAMLNVELPQIRAIADDEAARKRFFFNLLPDATLGLADYDVLFAGGSWRIPLWKEHTYVTVGYTWTRQTLPREGFVVGQRLPSDTDPGSVIVKEKTRELRMGLSLELFKLKF